MKQIIVNVSDLCEKEKESVNKALAKITGATKMRVTPSEAALILAPDSYGSLSVGWSSTSEYKEATHSPQEVLEMASMTEKRKVRSDFDPKKAYSVNVSNCTEDEKKKVQQAFFDVGFLWSVGGKEYRHLGAEQYSNVYIDGSPSVYLLFGEAKESNITPKKFFELVYEPEYQGHPHAHLMAQYTEDAKTTSRPWELWQLKDIVGNWITIGHHPAWEPAIEYRRKPKTKIINGVEIPDISFIPEHGGFYYFPDIDRPTMYGDDYRCHNPSRDEMRMKGNRCYPYTEKGKRAAILHAKALLSLV